MRRTKSDKTQTHSSETNAAKMLILRGRLVEELGTINSSGKINDLISADFCTSVLVPGMLFEMILSYVILGIPVMWASRPKLIVTAC